MKISNSKKQLARIISENGGWREGGMFSAQDQDGEVFFYTERPSRYESVWRYVGVIGGKFIKCDEALPNWHQTILSRAEYFHLYPAPDAKPEFCESVTRSIPEPSNKPTIEQLAADYRNLLDFARRKQEEANDAKADADARLKALELAGEALGLLVSPINANQESELVIEVRVGDEVECVESNIKRDKYNGMVGRLRLIDESDAFTPYLVDFGECAEIWCHEVKFIRRP